MNREMKAALSDALNEILSMSPEEFLAEARSVQSGAVYEFFMDSKRFAEFDISELEQLHMSFSEPLLIKTSECFSDSTPFVVKVPNQSIEQAGYALAA